MVSMVSSISRIFWRLVSGPFCGVTTTFFSFTGSGATPALKALSASSAPSSTIAALTLSSTPSMPSAQVEQPPPALV